jgi:general secretion pathway protein C
MQKLSNSKIISIISILLGLLLFAKLIGLALWWYLPNEGKELNTQQTYQTAYQRVDFKNMLKKSKVVEKKVQQKSAYSIDSMVLKGLYGSGDYGFCIVAPKAAPTRTKILEVGEAYKGYRLKEILFDRVVFVKSAKEYVLLLEKSAGKNLDKMVTKVSSTRGDEPKTIEKKDIKFYTKNPKKFWKEIGIVEHKRDGKLQGFRITKIKKGSKLETLGLQKDDILIGANNMELNSLQTVAKLYKNIDKLDDINLVFLRDNQEMEINYEIN